MIFYPCMGQNNRGLLAALCAERTYSFVRVQLLDADDRCRMSNMGYVSNINGKLVCDPDITFNNEEPTQGSDLLPQLQCDQ